MSGRFLQYASLAGKQVPIYVAQEVRHAGYRRAVDAIEPSILSSTAENVKVAAEGSKMLSESQKSAAGFITITSMPHPSDRDPNFHSTILVQDDQGGEVCKGHVVPDQNKQELVKPDDYDITQV